MSIEFIDLNKYILKIVVEGFATILIVIARGDARTDNNHTIIKKIRKIRFFYA
jgi:hypothetical protein